MKVAVTTAAIWTAIIAIACGEVTLDFESFGKCLGGWQKHSQSYAQYQVSGVKFRSFRPESTITPDGGTYVSMRIDHVRGVFSSDDHAMLEMTINREGGVVSAQSSIAIQGRSISSDVIQGANKAGSHATGIDKAVQIGADLVADLSSKLLRTKLVEPGRVAYPSAVRHNYNLLFQAIRVNGVAVHDPMLLKAATAGKKAEPEVQEKPVEKPETLANEAAPLQINGYSTAVSAPLEQKKKD